MCHQEGKTRPDGLTGLKLAGSPGPTGRAAAPQGTGRTHGTLAPDTRELCFFVPTARVFGFQGADLFASDIQNLYPDHRSATRR